MSRLNFPDGFTWGAATAAYQIEGAAHEDGRGRSIWDTYSEAPGNVVNGDTGAVAADHYHRWRADIALMQELGLDAYRFSIAWPRIQPTGSGPANRRGLDFYRQLVAGLHDAGIEPYPTLYHWDLPQPLEDAGGWPARETAERFADYAAIMAAELPEVRHWLTLNEPLCSAYLGYGLGRHAPGVRDSRQAVRAAHHLLLGHGLAVAAIRGPNPTAQVGIVLNLEPMRPETPSVLDVDAALLVDGMQNRLFLDPIFRGRYPADVLDHLAPLMALDHIHDGDLATIAAPIDVLGVNYYRPTVVAGRDANGHEDALWPGDARISTRTVDGPQTAIGWGVDSHGLEEILVRVRRDYGNIPMLVTENGAAYDDEPDDLGFVRDRQRLDYIDQHLRAAHRAIAAGVDLRGYFVWSLLDNFEWAEGYARRFGIVRVDYETQQRTPKESARWYSKVIAANGLVA
jgi:beta-glucosidase